MSKEQSTHVRSMHLDDDIYEELRRIRGSVSQITSSPINIQESLQLQPQFSWNELMNMFLILYHGNGDWRSKVKEVDSKVWKRLSKEMDKIDIADDDTFFKKEKAMRKAIEHELYASFLDKQHKNLFKYVEGTKGRKS